MSNEREKLGMKLNEEWDDFIKRIKAEQTQDFKKLVEGMKVWNKGEERLKSDILNSLE